MPVKSIEHTFYFKIKMVLDKIAAVLALILLSIPMLVIAIIIKRDSKGPVFFRQERIGFQQKPFMMFKFRTMYEGSENQEREIYERSNSDFVQTEDDKRITKVGRIFRSHSIDEIPQVFNILLGHMSFIGPRPLIRLEFEHMNEVQLKRYKALPGLSGLAQINGRSSLNADQKTMYDLDYIDNFSLWQDIAIVFKTFPAVFKKKNAI